MDEDKALSSQVYEKDPLLVVRKHRKDVKTEPNGMNSIYIL